MRVSNFNPRSPCGERRQVFALSVRLFDHFNPRSPCGERRVCHFAAFGFVHQFQSTLPVRGATSFAARSPHSFQNFNPRSPCGERHKGGLTPTIKAVFQSTLPVRGATLSLTLIAFNLLISIHAPRAGSDRNRPHVNASSDPFQSTLPVRGATVFIPSCNGIALKFQSTLPVRGATNLYKTIYIFATISIHAPRAGSDRNIAQISDDRAAILRHGFQTISPPTAEKSLSANKKLFLMPFSAREPPGFFMFTAGSRPAAGQKINVSVTSIEGLAPICFTLPSYAEPIT